MVQNPFLSEYEIKLKQKDTNEIKTLLIKEQRRTFRSAQVLNQFSYDSKVAQGETSAMESEKSRTHQLGGSRRQWNFDIFSR